MHRAVVAVELSVFFARKFSEDRMLLQRAFRIEVLDRFLQMGECLLSVELLVRPKERFRFGW